MLVFHFLQSLFGSSVPFRTNLQPTWIYSLTRALCLVDETIAASSENNSSRVSSSQTLLQLQLRLSTDTQALQASLLSQQQNVEVGEAHKTLDDRRWTLFLQLGYERVVALNSRALQNLLGQDGMQMDNVPTWSQLRTSIVKSAAKSLQIFEELLIHDLLKYSHSFM